VQNVNASFRRGGIRSDETLNRKQLSHLLRAATRIADDPDIIVIGSQAILGAFDAQNLPDDVTMSVEADIAFRDDPDEVKADEVDGSIGELSDFHEEFGYYAQGVIITTAKLPSGWEDRVVSFDAPSADPSQAVCIEAHDLVVSKLVAGRDKDRDFATALLAAGLISKQVLMDRADMLDVPGAVIKRVRTLIMRCAKITMSQS